MTANATRTILLVEDSLDDVILTKESFRRTDRPVDIWHVENGTECMKYLRKLGSYCDAPTPDVVLLDLNMPVMDGRDVLAEVGNDPLLKHLPVVVLSTSRAAADLYDCYHLGCRSYLVKPVDFNQFQQLIDEFCGYWFDTVALPPE